MAKFQTILSVFLLYYLLWNPASVPATAAFSLILEKGTLSVSAENVPLQAILQDLTAKGIQVRIDPAINPLVSVNFNKRPIEQGLEALIKFFKQAERTG
jgi:hypothetical protein